MSGSMFSKRRIWAVVSSDQHMRPDSLPGFALICNTQSGSLSHCLSIYLYIVGVQNIVDILS